MKLKISNHSRKLTHKSSIPGSTSPARLSGGGFDLIASAQSGNHPLGSDIMSSWLLQNLHCNWQECGSAKCLASDGVAAVATTAKHTFEAPQRTMIGILLLLHYTPVRWLQSGFTLCQRTVDSFVFNFVVSLPAISVFEVNENDGVRGCVWLCVCVCASVQLERMQLWTVCPNRTNPFPCPVAADA